MGDALGIIFLIWLMVSFIGACAEEGRETEKKKRLQDAPPDKDGTNP